MRLVWAFATVLLLTGEAFAAGHGLECPARAPAEWGGTPGLLNAVQVLSAQRGETIDIAVDGGNRPDAARRAEIGKFFVH